jgi:hypothetical protein
VVEGGLVIVIRIELLLIYSMFVINSNGRKSVLTVTVRSTLIDFEDSVYFVCISMNDGIISVVN